MALPTTPIMPITAIVRTTLILVTIPTVPIMLTTSITILAKIAVARLELLTTLKL